MKRKIIALCLIVAMLGVAVIGGTMAYFTDTAEAVNVMTIGSVKIDLVEQQRDANGDMITLDPTTGYQIIPAVYDESAWADDTASANDKVFHADMKNVYDKFVSVKNTGRSDAYVRLFFAFEDSDSISDKLHISTTGTMEFLTDPAGEALNIEIDGVTYVVGCYTYAQPIEAGETSEYSLKQFFFDKTTKQEDVEAAGNEYTILVLAQAIQASGFNDAVASLNEGFGVPTAATADTTDGDTLNVEAWFSALEVPTVVANADELKAAIANGGSIVLGADIDFDVDSLGTLAVGSKKVTLDLNGHDIVGVGVNSKNAAGTGWTNDTLISVGGGGVLDITGKGTISLKTTGEDMVWGAMSCVLHASGATVNVGPDVTLSNLGGTSMAFAVDTNPWENNDGSMTVNLNGTTLNSSYIAIRIRDTGATDVIVNATDCTINAEKRCVWGQCYGHGNASHDSTAVCNLTNCTLNYNPAVENSAAYSIDNDCSFMTINVQ